MEQTKELDATGFARRREVRKMKAGFSIIFLFFIAQSLPGAGSQDQIQQVASLLIQGRELIEEEQFSEAERILRDALQLNPENAEGHFLLGFALAKRENLLASRKEFEKALLLRPTYTQALAELAGVEFRLGNNPKAVKNLRRALALDADGEYARRFLAALLYLDDKKMEALHYWNTIGEPCIGAIEYRTSHSVDAQLLNHLFNLNENEIFRREQVLDIRWKQNRFHLGPSFRWQLTPQSQGDWDLEVSIPPNHTLSSTYLVLLQNAVRAPLYREIAIEHPMALRSGKRLKSSFRWDEPRKRFRGSAWFPFLTSSSDGLSLVVDLRDEEWVENISGIPFSLEKQQLLAEYKHLFTGRKSLSLNGGYEHQRLSFSNAHPNLNSDPHHWRFGFEWNQLVGLTVGDAFRLNWGARLDTFKGFGGKGSGASQVSSILGLDWAIEEPSLSQLSFTLRKGFSSENLPLDHCFVAGIGQDDPLPLRAHPTVNEGRKGNSPMGRRYFLANLEFQRRLLRWKMLDVDGLVFSDTAMIAKSPFEDSAPKWFQDLGFGLRFGAMGQKWIEALFGFDLRASSFHIWLGIPVGR